MSLSPGLSEFLSWELPEAPIRPTRVENLSFVSAGAFLSNATELLASWRMWKLVERVRAEFDFVVIDSPPLLAVSDGVLLANVADGVVLVTDRGRSRRDQVRAAMQRLLQTGVAPLGAVLNRGEVEFSYYRYSRPGPAQAAVQPEVIEGEEAPPNASA
jgi:receptor protein-tyrosine kinase